MGRRLDYAIGTSVGYGLPLLLLHQRREASKVEFFASRMFDSHF